MTSVVRAAWRRRGTVQPDIPGLTSALKSSRTAWTSSAVGARPCVGPTVGPNGEEGPVGCFESSTESVTSSISAIMDFPSSSLAAVPSFPFSTALTTASLADRPRPIIPASGHLTFGYCSMNARGFLVLRAGMTPTLGKARKSSRVPSDGLSRYAFARRRATSWKEVTNRPGRGLDRPGSLDRDRKRS